MRSWSALLAVLASVGSVGYASAAEEETHGDYKSISLRTHSIEPPYLDADMQSRWFDFGGDTVIRTDKYIRLTPDRPSRSGWLWSRVPLTATNWQITVDFQVHGAGNLYGDGMAMWLTKNRAQEGPVFGSMDKWDGLGIFIDTYKNHRPGVVFPLVMASLNDGTHAYDKDNDGLDLELKGCSARGIRGATIPTKLRATYFQEKSLKVELQYKSDDKWEECFEAENVKIPPVTYLGFTAETGELTDNHDIISVQTKNLYQPYPGSGSTGSTASSGKGSSSSSSSHDGSDHIQREGGSWTWFFLKFILFGLAVVGTYIGFTAWRLQQARSRF